MTLDTDFFRKVMGHFATGVTIATTRGQAGLAGLTVNSFTSVSLTPPLVLICVDLRSQVLSSLRESGVFAINILTREQEVLSNCFATSSEERYTYFFRAEHHFAATGAPILANTLGFIDARVTSEYPGGDHAILLGQVEAMGYDGQVFFMPGANSSLSTLPALTGAPDPASNNEHACAQDEHSPLLYYRGQYRHLTRHQQYKRPEAMPAPDPA